MSPRLPLVAAAAALLASTALLPLPASAADESRVTAYLTGYSYWDNTPAGTANISHPVVHGKAGGTGTYDDPVTVAVGHSIINGRDILDWPAGTRFYVPKLQRYLVVEDTCGDGPTPQNGACHTGYPAGTSTWLDVYVDGADASRGQSDSCMSKITGATTVLVDPADDYKVSPGPISDGTCSTYAEAPVRAVPEAAPSNEPHAGEPAGNTLPEGSDATGTAGSEAVQAPEESDRDRSTWERSPQKSSDAWSSYRRSPRYDRYDRPSRYDRYDRRSGR